MNLSQIVISSGIKHAPSVFAFTEQDIAMLSTVFDAIRQLMAPPDQEKRKIGFVVKERQSGYRTKRQVKDV
jgi:hypothetical protein